LDEGERQPENGNTVPVIQGVLQMALIEDIALWILDQEYHALRSGGFAKSICIVRCGKTCC
jgi:hypothetical protein